MRQDYFIPKLCGIEKLDATHFTVLFLRAKPNYILKTHSISPKPFNKHILQNYTSQRFLKVSELQEMFYSIYFHLQDKLVLLEF